jgi:alanine dehydrogenase
MSLLLDNNAIAPLVSPAEMIAVLDNAYRAHAAGRGVCAPRLDFQAPDAHDGTNYQLGLAAGMSGPYGALRIKSDMVFESIIGGRRRKEKYCIKRGTYMGLVLLFDTGSGELLAILHDGFVQRMRVGADSALGVRYMAREDTPSLGLLGSGGMARTHVDAICEVRPIRRVRIFSPTRENRERFARELHETRGLDAEPVDAPEAVYAGADIVASCANAIGPVILGRHIEPGTHLTCIGGTFDAEANARVDIALRFGDATAPIEIVPWEFREECLSFVPGGRKAAHGGTRRFAEVPRERCLTFREFLADPTRGRTRPDQVTFSERGNIHGVQFAAVAGFVYEKARAAGVGLPLATELFVQSIRN